MTYEEKLEEMENAVKSEKENGVLFATYPNAPILKGMKLGRLETLKEMRIFMDTLYANWMIHPQLDGYVLNKKREVEKELKELEK